MTEQEAISQVVQTANEQVGTREGANNWNPYAAALDPLGITYGNKQNLAWCGEFVLWVFVHCFGVDRALEMLCSPKPSGIPLCSAGAQYFKDKGRWTSRAEVGNVIFFTVGGGINHTGIVTGVSSLSVTTVEGNSSDMVQRITYAIRDGRIAGYGRPQWSVVAQSATTEPAVEIPASDSEFPNNCNCTEKLPILRKGDVGEVVRAAQSLLNTRGASCGVYGADGDFGNATEAACLAFQRRNGLEADGVIGQQTWAKLLGIF
jgi:hypothetical protein